MDRVKWVRGLVKHLLGVGLTHELPSGGGSGTEVVNLNIGMWRSLVAHLTGGQGAGGSNPLIPT